MSLTNLDHIEIVDREVTKILAGKTEAERFAIGMEMNRSARRLLTDLIATENPDWTAETVRAEVSRRIASGEVPKIELKDFL